MCDSPKGWLAGCLVVWLMLTIVRQVLDLIGRLWIPVIFNLFQILSCISGIFSISYRRLYLLVILSLSCILSIAYNVFLILWYFDVIKGYPRLLSAGLPYGQSFFIRNTPGCETFFNLTTAQWNQKSCSIPYNNAESVQGVMHIVLAILTLVFSIFLLCERRYQREKTKNSSKPELKVVEEQNDINYSYMNNTYASPNLKNLKEKLDGTVLKKKENGTDYSKLKEETVRRPEDSHQAALEKFHDDYAKIDQSTKVNRKSEYLSPENLTFNSNSDYEGYQPIARPASQGAVAARLANHSGQIPINKTKKPVSSGSLTALIAFDPKSKDILKVNKHHNDSDDEETIDYKMTKHENVRVKPRKVPEETVDYKILRNDSVKTIDKGEYRAQREYSVDGYKQLQRSDSQMSTPSVKAPELPYAQGSSLFGSGQPSNSTDETDCSTEFAVSPPINNIQQTVIDSKPSFTARTNDSQKQIRSRPVNATSFPSTQYEPQRRIVGMSIATQIPLTRPLQSQIGSNSLQSNHHGINLHNSHFGSSVNRGQPGISLHGFHNHSSTVNFKRTPVDISDEEQLPPPLNPLNLSLTPPKERRKTLDVHGVLV